MNDSSSHPPVFILRGPKFSGKSLFVERLAARLSSEGVRVTGFFQRGIFDEAGRKTGHDLVLLPKGESRPIARRSEENGGWRFFDKAFATAAESIDEEAEICLIDEIGPLELKGAGHRSALNRAMSLTFPLLIVVREELADEVPAITGGSREIVEICHVESEIDANIARIVSLLKTT